MNYPEGKMVPVDSPLAKGESHHGSDQDKGEKEDASMSATDLRAVHDKSCELVKMIDAGHLDEKLSKGWVQSKLTLANDYLTAIHDYIVHDKEAADSEHGDDRRDGGDMGGGFLISIEKKLSK
tara:strand:+ start:146 stop:514 length:369 start_codon:yes stop_codon:yes gene_type:complete